MALPVLAAGAAALARLAIRQGKKIKSLAKKPTPGQKSIEKVTKGQRAYAKGQVKGAAAGAAATGAGMSGTSSKTKDKKTTTSSKDQRTNPKDYPKYKKDTKSASSFREAFAKAKKEGKKTFTFEGRTYSTKTKK